MVTFLKFEIEQFTDDRLKRMADKKLTLVAIEEDLLVFRVDKN